VKCLFYTAAVAGSLIECDKRTQDNIKKENSRKNT